MAGLVQAIHVLLCGFEHKDADARHKAGHGEEKKPRQTGAFDLGKRR
jgi:hypothetical protein